MWFSLLGPPEVRDEGEALPLGGRQQRSVLALLLLRAGRDVGADGLVTEIWGELPPDGARNSLYTYVSNLRRIIGQQRIVHDGNGYRFEPHEKDAVDVGEFESGLARARRLLDSDPGAAVALIDQALSLWRGRPYDGLEDLPSIAPEAARLEDLRLCALEDRIEAELRAGRTPEVGGVEVLIGDHPYRERFWELLAWSLYRGGRQTDALRTLTRLRRMLADDVGVDPSPAVARLEEQILLHDPALESGAAPPSNLPAPVTSFVGRMEELDRLERLINEHRLVTVTGPGGIGKTRLALELAGRLVGGFRDGVWLIDLTPATDPDGVVGAVTSTLQLGGSASVDPVAALLRHLRGRSALLLLDNCEHVADAVGHLVAEILPNAPKVRVVATSRRVLRTAGEYRFPLEGLSTAGSEMAPGDAERLFATRAAAVRPGYRMNSDTQVTVASICRHLDGVPLAIELAAARADTLSAVEIAHHLPDRFELLGDGHELRSVHRSLRASLDWS
ncbi:MAG: winged helix-turn-helix domain-containing protein, partial [Thermoanaerobaculales bacterium]|nr:winged helix-turn-helix domain-containing protein [Thermoanaerobaculales bacterium]